MPNYISGVFRDGQRFASKLKTLPTDQSAGTDSWVHQNHPAPTIWEELQQMSRVFHSCPLFSCKRVQWESAAGILKLQHSWLISKSFIYCIQLCFFIFLQHVESPVKFPNCCYSNSIYALIVKWKTDGGFNFNGIHCKNCVHALNIIYHFLSKHLRLKELMISHMKFFSSINKIKGNCALLLRSLTLESIMQQFGNC